MKRICLTFTLLLMAIGPATIDQAGVAQAQTSTGHAGAEGTKLTAYLQDYLKRPNVIPDATTRFVAAFVDLNGDNVNEAIVHVVGRRQCGSGGCLTLVLEPTNSSYRVVTRITITRPPIRVLPRTSHGWRHLSVWVQGGGIIDGYDAELKFDGRSYPTNPSVSPAERLPTPEDGNIVISSVKDAMRLYP